MRPVKLGDGRCGPTLRLGGIGGLFAANALMAHGRFGLRAGSGSW
jgi:hypothetical protein